LGLLNIIPLKKYFVLTILFVLPLVAYLFFASGINNFAKLPILEKDVLNVDTFSEKTFDNKISILIFLGNNIQKKKGDILNLNQKIYKRFYEFNDFQFIALGPIEIKKQIEDLVGQLSTGTNTEMTKWFFLFQDSEDTKNIFKSLRTNLELDEFGGSPYVFIIDKNGYLRGRNDSDGIKFGYDIRSVAELNNYMVDDIKIILAEYRLALKKNNIFNNQ
tara:strand:+ start:1485 stop:2138 length:654 start_codon:yes stop_codon:yes gene_type:complete